MNGHELLAQLQAHPDWLDYEVVLLAPDWDETSDGILRDVMPDCFAPGEPVVLVLDTIAPRTSSDTFQIFSSAFSNDTPMKKTDV